MAADLVGLSGVRAGGLAVKGQFPRNGRCGSGSVELLGTRAWASSLREADAGALPGLARLMSTGCARRSSRSLGALAGLASSFLRLRKGFCTADRVNKAIPM